MTTFLALPESTYAYVTLYSYNLIRYVCVRVPFYSKADIYNIYSMLLFDATSQIRRSSFLFRLFFSFLLLFFSRKSLSTRIYFELTLNGLFGEGEEMEDGGLK